MANTPVKKQSMANFMSLPSTSKFLQEQLSERKGEFINNMIALTDSDSNLAECDPSKLMKVALNATSLNLPLNKNLGFAYVIAYKGIPSFQIGYKGWIQLAIRTGVYEYLNACEIREDEILRNKITGEIKFLGDKPQNDVIGYLAYLKLKSGFTASLYMSLEEIEAHAVRFSKSYQYDKKNNKSSSKWSDSAARPKMAIKTALKGLLGTYGVITTEISNAMENDNDNEVVSPSNRNIQDAEIVEQKDNSKPAKVVV